MIVYLLTRRIDGVDSRSPAGNESASHSSPWAIDLTAKIETSEGIHVPFDFAWPWSHPPSDEHMPQTSSRKLLFAVDSDWHRDPQLATAWRISGCRMCSLNGNINFHHPRPPPPRLSITADERQKEGRSHGWQGSNVFWTHRAAARGNSRWLWQNVQDL